MTVSEPAAVELLSSVSRLVRSARSYAHLQNQQLGRTGLPLGILAKLHLQPMRPGDLATVLGVSPSAVSRAVAALVDEGYVERTADPRDARACSLGLTPAGEAELLTLHHEQAHVVAQILGAWDDAKAAQLAGLLDEFGTALAASVGTSPSATSLTTTLATTSTTTLTTTSTTTPADSAVGTTTTQNQKAFA